MEEKVINEVARKIRKQLERQLEAQADNTNQAVRLMEMSNFIKTEYTSKATAVTY
ncbi:MAG: hypothetical protein JXR10_03225 [Cyclobacteriaceae bacterium]